MAAKKGKGNVEKKETPFGLPERFPRKVHEGPPMDYSGTAFPKPVKRQKRGKK